MPDMDRILDRLESVSDKISHMGGVIETALKSIEQRFESIDKRFEVIEKRFEWIDRKFESVEKRFDGVDMKLLGLERGHVELRGQMDHLLKDFDALSLNTNRKNGVSAKEKEDAEEEKAKFWLFKWAINNWKIIAVLMSLLLGGSVGHKAINLFWPEAAAISSVKAEVAPSASKKESRFAPRPTE